MAIKSGRFTEVTLALCAAGLMAGCTVGPHYQPPAAPTVGTYTSGRPLPEAASVPGTSGGAQHFDPTMDVPAQWWTLFRSPELDRMVREALEKSPSLAQATARLKEAQEESRARTGATKRPTVSANAGVQEEQVNLASFGVPFPNPSPFSLLNGSVAVSYALDLFGANRRLIEGLNAQVDYQKWQFQAARLMLAGNVVSAAIRQGQLHSQIEISRQILQIQQQQLDITEQRYRAGGVSRLDVLARHAAVAQTQAAIPPLEQQLDAVNHQLAVLMGKTPAEAQVGTIHLESLHLPERLPLSVPSVLARQRPDILASESLLHQASANVGVATANLYPQIVLSGSFGADGTSLISGGKVWNVGASLAAPIYNGGALRAERRKAVASYDEAGSVYQQTVLQAFREVADSLRAIEHDAQTLDARADAAHQAEASYDIASRRYDSGGISQLVLLDAQCQHLQTMLDQAVPAASRYSDSVTLLQSLGGGWWNEAHKSVTARTSAANAP